MRIEDGVSVNVRTGPEAGAVQRMFAGIAPRYDFLNHLLSVSIDRRWRRLAVARLSDLLERQPDARYLDLCSGTADLAIETRRALRGTVIASDFCHPMIAIGAGKIRDADIQESVFAVEADSLGLPFRDGCFDGITIGFGLRNLEDRVRGFSEMLRLLRPGGALVVLEFSRPVIPVFREAFEFYFRNVLPRLGGLVSGQGTAYRYLHDSVGVFPSQDELVVAMRSLGFKDVGYRNLSGGIAALHWGRKGYEGSQ